jgi:hypothetical protein
VIELFTAQEAFGGHQLRCWSGIAVDEGVGLIAIVEVSDAAGRPLARFEEFLDAFVRNLDPAWPRDDSAAAGRLQSRALDRARAAIAADTLPTLNGHRFEAALTDSSLPGQGAG